MSPRAVIPIDPLPDWTPEERPRMPGSPSTPWHPPHVRVAYFAVGMLVILTGGLGNGLVSANLQVIQGHLGLTPSEAAWLSGVYVMVNASANLILFKCRQRFGIRHFAEFGISAYALVCFLNLLVADFRSELLLRAVAGFAAAPLSALGMFYTMQAFPLRRLGNALCLALGLMQVATPLASALSPALLNGADWHVVSVFELGMALMALAAIVVLKLPPGIRIHVFEPLDFLSFALLAPAIGLVGAVLAQGRYQWWPDHPWMAWALIAAIALFGLAFLIEHHRARPLVMTRWLGSGDALRFVLGAMGIRFLLAEQSYTAPALMRALGMGPDQLQALYGVISLGVIAGAIVAAVLFGPTRILGLIGTAVALILVASFLDHTASSQTRPADLYLSQGMIALATGMFMGPLLLMAVGKVMARGADHIVTFSVLFGISQGIGGLLGPALIGTYQVAREHVYSADLNANINPADPVIAQRLALQQGLYGKVIADPVLNRAQGMAQLGQIATREANVRAYNDAALLNSSIAITLLFWTFFDILKALPRGLWSAALRLDRRRRAVLRVYSRLSRKAVS